MRKLRLREPKWPALGHTADAPAQQQDSGPSCLLRLQPGIGTGVFLGLWQLWLEQLNSREMRHLFLSLQPLPSHLKGSVTTISYHSSKPLVSYSGSLFLAFKRNKTPCSLLIKPPTWGCDSLPLLFLNFLLQLNFLNKWSTLRPSFPIYTFLLCISGLHPTHHVEALRLPKISFLSSLMALCWSLWPPCTDMVNSSLHQNSSYKHTSLFIILIFICIIFKIMKIGAHYKTWNHLKMYRKTISHMRNLKNMNS